MLRDLAARILGLGDPGPAPVVLTLSQGGTGDVSVEGAVRAGAARVVSGTVRDLVATLRPVDLHAPGLFALRFEARDGAVVALVDGPAGDWPADLTVSLERGAFVTVVRSLQARGRRARRLEVVEAEAPSASDDDAYPYVPLSAQDYADFVASQGTPDADARTAEERAALAALADAGLVQPPYVPAPDVPMPDPGIQVEPYREAPVVGGIPHDSAPGPRSDDVVPSYPHDVAPGSVAQSDAWVPSGGAYDR